MHHGGAGTTHVAARAGRAQVIVPHNYDQFYWRERVQALGVGAEGPTREQLTTTNLVAALQAALQPGVSERARVLASSLEQHGVQLAAQRVIE